jgi:hypothetical protein
MGTAAETRRSTVDEVMRMVETGVLGEDERLELIGGQLAVMTPQGPPHITAITLLARALERAYPEPCWVRVQGPVLCGPHDLPGPDLAVVRMDERQMRVRHPRADEALLAVEVAVTSQAHDGAKAALYARAGCPELWIVDLPGGVITVHRAPGPDGTWGEVGVVRAGEDLVLPGGAGLVPAALALLRDPG